MTISKRLKLAISLAPLLGALAFAIPAHAAPPGGSQPHVQSGGTFHHDHDFHGDRDRHDRDRFGFGFGFGFGDPWWGWGPADYWGYPYPYYYPPYPYYYPPDPAYYAAPQGPPPQAQAPAPSQFTGAPPQQFWYYCDNPQGYYPYVQNCGAAWKQVAATPPTGSGNTITPKARP
jgi:hypothetical protein